MPWFTADMEGHSITNATFNKIMLKTMALTFNTFWQFGIVFTCVYQGKKLKMRARRTNYKECFCLAKMLDIARWLQAGPG